MIIGKWSKLRRVFGGVRCAYSGAWRMYAVVFSVVCGALGVCVVVLGACVVMLGVCEVVLGVCACVALFDACVVVLGVYSDRLSKCNPEPYFIAKVFSIYTPYLDNKPSQHDPRRGRASYANLGTNKFKHCVGIP